MNTEEKPTQEMIDKGEKAMREVLDGSVYRIEQILSVYVMACIARPICTKTNQEIVEAHYEVKFSLKSMIKKLEKTITELNEVLATNQKELQKTQQYFKEGDLSIPPTSQAV